MLNSKDIRNVKFSRSVGGYKQEEVDILLDKIEVDYDQFERTASELAQKIDSLNAEVETYKSSQLSIQNVLVSAQTLADSIVAEAKEKSEQIIAAAEQRISEIKKNEESEILKLTEESEIKKNALKADFERTEAELGKKKAAIDRAMEDSIKRQQRLFDKLKLEVIALKAEINEVYKKHIAVYDGIPDVVPMSPEEAAKVMSAKFDEAPDLDKFVSETEAEPQEAPETAQKALDFKAIKIEDEENDKVADLLDADEDEE